MSIIRDVTGPLPATGTCEELVRSPDGRVWIHDGEQWVQVPGAAAARIEALEARRGRVAKLEAYVRRLEDGEALRLWAVGSWSESELAEIRESERLEIRKKYGHPGDLPAEEAAP